MGSWRAQMARWRDERLMVGWVAGARSSVRAKSRDPPPP